MLKYSLTGLVVLLAALLLAAPEVLPMSLNPLKTCVFSAVKARLTINGVPVKGATVVRRWKWHSMREERTATDAAGNFSFPPVYESSVTRFLPMEFVVAQGMFVVVDGAETQFWANTKRETAENAELGGRALALVCELKNEMKLTESFGSLLSTVCTWE